MTQVLTSIFLFLFPLTSQADEYYPTRLAPRLLGTSQGQVGDCEAEADVNALEQAFAIRGFPVRLSLFYRHAFNRRDPSSQTSASRLDLNETDQHLMDRIGGILPEYMWPEDGRGFPEVTSKRPHPSEAIAFHTAMPHTDQFGFKTELKTLSPGFNESIDVTTLKRLISLKKMAVTARSLSVCAEPLRPNIGR